MARNRSLDQSGEISTNTGGSFAPLPAGKYEATVFGITDGKYKNGDNKGRDNLNVQFKISAGQVGANRRIFDLIPLDPTWAGGGDAFRYFQFFAAVQGMPEKDFRIEVKARKEAKEDIELPDDADMLGTEVTLTLKVSDDKYKFDKAVKEWKDNGEKGDAPVKADFQRNDISNVEVAGKGNMDKDEDGNPPAAAGKAKAKATVLEL